MSAALFVHALLVQLLIERSTRAREQAGEFDELLYQGILRYRRPACVGTPATVSGRDGRDWWPN